MIVQSHRAAEDWNQDAHLNLFVSKVELCKLQPASTDKWNLG